MPLRPEISIQISGTSTPSRSRQTMVIGGKGLEAGCAGSPGFCRFGGRGGRHAGARAEGGGEDELQAICAPAHPIARLKAASAKQLSVYPFLSREQGSGTREVIDRYFEKSGLPPDALEIVMALGSPEALEGLVSA